MEENLVTIAIPAYKRKWLRESIESAISQDYTNLEIIIVDDNSPQHLYDEVKSFLKDKRLRYYKNEENLGKKSIVYNWNRCVDYANGDFFILLCDDDILESNFVSSLLLLADKYPNVNVFHSGKERMHPDGRIDRLAPWPEYESFESFIDNEINGKRPLTITEFMYRMPILKKVKYSVFPIGWYSDKASIINLCQKGGIASSSQTFVKFRLGYEHISGNTTYQVDKVKSILLYYETLKRYSFYNKYKSKLLNKQRYEIYENFRIANNLQKFSILRLIPNNILTYKQKFGLIIRSLCDKKS